ncbi:MAG: amidase [Myxococcales bacterium]|nr:amidase [Myxococcales bacterium]
MNDYTAVDATELAARVRRKEVHPRELVREAASAIERVNPTLNAVVYRMYDSATERAEEPLPEGPLAGVPMVLKDFDGFVRDVPFTASSRFLEGFVPDQDAEIIARLRRAGLLFLAKTNLPELAIVGTTEPEWRGPTRNPWSPDHSTGGSSGGSAALVASGAIPAGHGGDGGGSLRIPASHCGLVGLKATRGRIPLGPHRGEDWGGYVQWGVLTRTVRDQAAFLDVIAGPMPGDPYAAPGPAGPYTPLLSTNPGKLRIGYCTDSLFGNELHRDCEAAVTRTARALASLGHVVEEAKPQFDRHALVRAYLTQIAVGVAAEIDDFAALTKRTPHPSKFEASTWMLAQIGRSMTGVQLQHARDAVQTAGRQLGAFHERYDLLLTATVAQPPVRIGELALSRGQRLGLSLLRRFPARGVMQRLLDTLAEDNLERTPNTQLFNQTGQPAISVPALMSDGVLPIGAQLAAPLGREDWLLQVASQLEQAQAWKTWTPQVSA